jgi:hypothetical protein
VVAKALADRDVTGRQHQGDRSPGLACSLVRTIDSPPTLSHRETLTPLGWSA